MNDPTSPTAEHEPTELELATARLAELGQGVPQAVKIKGPAAVLDYVRERLEVAEAEAVELERAAQDAAAEAELEGAAEEELGEDAPAEAVAELEVGAAELEPGAQSVHGTSEAGRADAYADALHGLATVRGILDSLQAYVTWAAEALEAEIRGSESPVEETSPLADG